MDEQKPWQKMMLRSPKNDEGDGLDLFETPPLTTCALFSQMDFGNKIWEPACGKGAMSEVMKKLGYTVRSTDIKDYGYEGHDYTFDFMQVDPDPGMYDIVTNPPYNIHLKWIEQSLKIARRYVALLFPLVYLTPANKREFITNSVSFSLIIPGWRSKFIMPGRTEPGGMKDYAWFVWDKEKGSDYIFPTHIVDKSQAQRFAEIYDIKV